MDTIIIIVLIIVIGVTISFLRDRFWSPNKHDYTKQSDDDLDDEGNTVFCFDLEHPRPDDISRSIALKYRGEIGRFSLEQWWHNSFTRSERKEIIQACCTYDGRDFLTTEKIPKPHWLKANGEFWYKWGDDVDTMLAYADLCSEGGSGEYSDRFIEKALEMALSSQKLYKFKKAYAGMIYRYYRRRDVPKYFERAVWACKQLISITTDTAAEDNKFGPQEHIGFKQLAIIYEKQKKFEEAIELSRQAKEQGWWGTWDKRIERCTQKIARRDKK